MDLSHSIEKNRLYTIQNATLLLFWHTALHYTTHPPTFQKSPPIVFSLSLSTSSCTPATHLQRTDLKHRRPCSSRVIRDSRIATRQHHIRLARNGRRAVRGRRNGEGKASVDGGRAVEMMISTD